MTTRTTLAILAAAGIAVLIWGATPAVTKLAVGVFDPLSVAFMRTVFAAPVALALILGYRMPLPTSAKARWYLLGSSFSGLVGFVLLFTIGMRYTSGSHGALILAALPLFTGLVAALFDWRPLALRWWAGSALALAGEVVLILRGGSIEAGGLWGDLMVLAASFFSSLGYVCGARLAQTGYGARNVSLWSVAIASLAVTPLLALTADWDQFARADMAAWSSVLFLALGSTLVAYAAWIWALGRGGIARVGLAQYLQPPIGILAAVVMLGEPVTPPLILAGAAIVAGVVVATRS